MLSDNQRKAVVEFVSSRNVLVVLHTGSGRLVCFASLSWLFDALRGTGEASIVMVAAPPNSLMVDQVRSFTKKGLSTVL